MHCGFQEFFFLKLTHKENEESERRREKKKIGKLFEKQKKKRKEEREFLKPSGFCCDLNGQLIFLHTKEKKKIPLNI